MSRINEEGAIVNTEPQEQIVPQFNKNEIVKIINKAIANGEISVPSASGGTQLYKHSLTTDKGSFVIYDNDSTPITNTNLADRLSKAIKIVDEGDNIAISVFNKSILRVQGGFGGEEASFSETGTITISGTDTVTEL